MSGIAKVWDARTFALRRELKSYSAALNGTAFSRDSRFLVTAGDDLWIWETETGARLRAPLGRGSLYATSMSANGRIIAVGGADGFLGLFDCDVCLPMDGLVRLAKERAPRELTDRERKDFLGTGS